MKNILFIFAFVFAISCGINRDVTKSTDQTNLQGAWLAQSESQNGKTWNVSFLYVFRGDKVVFTDETGKEITYSFKLDTSGSLKLIIIQPDEKLNILAPVMIAYELDGDSLKIVIAPPGLRPTEISDKNNQELIICKRKGL